MSFFSFLDDDDDDDDNHLLSDTYHMGKTKVGKKKRKKKPRGKRERKKYVQTEHWPQCPSAIQSEPVSLRGVVGMEVMMCLVP
jgi:hypothetical protein